MRLLLGSLFFYPDAAVGSVSAEPVHVGSVASRKRLKNVFLNLVVRKALFCTSCSAEVICDILQQINLLVGKGSSAFYFDKHRCMEGWIEPALENFDFLSSSAAAVSLSISNLPLPVCNEKAILL